MSKSAIKLNFTSINANNLGNGIGLFDTINPGDTINLKSLSGGTNVSLTENNGTITISSSASGGGANTLVDLNDTTINTPQNGEVIRYATGSTTWENIDLYENLTDKILPRYDQATKSLCDSNIRNRNGAYVVGGYNIYGSNISKVNGFSYSGITNGNTSVFKQPIPFTDYSLNYVNNNAGLTKSCISIFVLNLSDSTKGVIHDIETNIRWDAYGGGYYNGTMLSQPKVTTHGNNFNSCVSIGSDVKGRFNVYVTANDAYSSYNICSTITQKTVSGIGSGGV